MATHNYDDAISNIVNKAAGKFQDLATAKFNEAAKEGFENGVQKGIDSVDVDKILDNGLNKKVKGKTVKVEVEVEPEIKNPEALEESLLKNLKSRKNKGVARYYTDAANALNKFNDAYKTYEKNQRRKVAKSTTKRDISEVVKWGNAYVARGGDIGKLDPKLRRFYKDNSQSNYSGKESYSLDNMKKIFGDIDNLISRGWDFSNLEIQLFGAIKNATSKAKKEVDKTIGEATDKATKKSTQKANKEAKKEVKKEETAKKTKDKAIAKEQKKVVDNSKKISALEKDLAKRDEAIAKLEEKQSKAREKQQNKYLDRNIKELNKELIGDTKTSQKNSFKAKKDKAYDTKVSRSLPRSSSTKKNNFALWENDYHTDEIKQLTQERREKLSELAAAPYIVPAGNGKYKRVSDMSAVPMTEKEAKEFLRLNVRRRKSASFWGDIDKLIEKSPESIGYFSGNPVRNLGFTIGNKKSKLSKEEIDAINERSKQIQKAEEKVRKTEYRIRELRQTDTEKRTPKWQEKYDKAFQNRENAYNELNALRSKAEQGRKYYAIDTSNMKLYKAYNEIGAQNVFNFMNNLEDFCEQTSLKMKEIESEATDATSTFKDKTKVKELYDVYLNNLSEGEKGVSYRSFARNGKLQHEAESQQRKLEYDNQTTALFREFRKAFPEFKDWGLDKFKDFLSQQVNLYSKSGLKEDGTYDEAILTQFKKEYGSGNAKARLLREMGYQGLDLSKTSFSSATGGSIILDAKNDVVIKSDKIKTNVLTPTKEDVQKTATKEYGERISKEDYKDVDERSTNPTRILDDEIRELEGILSTYNESLLELVRPSESDKLPSGMSESQKETLAEAYKNEIKRVESELATKRAKRQEIEAEYGINNEEIKELQRQDKLTERKQNKALDNYYDVLENNYQQLTDEERTTYKDAIAKMGRLFEFYKSRGETIPEELVELFESTSKSLDLDTKRRINEIDEELELKRKQYKESDLELTKREVEIEAYENGDKTLSEFSQSPDLYINERGEFVWREEELQRYRDEAEDLYYTQDRLRKEIEALEKRKEPYLKESSEKFFNEGIRAAQKEFEESSLNEEGKLKDKEFEEQIEQLQKERHSKNRELFTAQIEQWESTAKDSMTEDEWNEFSKIGNELYEKLNENKELTDLRNRVDRFFGFVQDKIKFVDEQGNEVPQDFVLDEFGRLQYNREKQLSEVEEELSEKQKILSEYKNKSSEEKYDNANEIEQTEKRIKYLEAEKERILKRIENDKKEAEKIRAEMEAQEEAEAKAAQERVKQQEEEEKNKPVKKETEDATDAAVEAEKTGDKLEEAGEQAQAATEKMKKGLAEVGEEAEKTESKLKEIGSVETSDGTEKVAEAIKEASQKTKDAVDAKKELEKSRSETNTETSEGTEKAVSALKEEEEQAKATAESEDKLNEARNESSDKASESAESTSKETAALKEQEEQAKSTAKAKEKEAKASAKAKEEEAKATAKVNEEQAKAEEKKKKRQRKSKKDTEVEKDNSEASQIDKATEAIEAEGKAAKEAAILKEDFVEQNRMVGDVSEDSAPSVDKATEAMKEEAKAADEAADALQRHKVISTRHVTENGNDRLKSYTYEDTNGRKVTKTERYDDDGNVTQTTTSQNTKYKDTAKKAADVLLELKKTQNLLEEEQFKVTNEQSKEKINSYKNRITELRNELTLATRAAHDFNAENERFINDTQEGSKFDYRNWRTLVDKQIGTGLIDEDIRHRNALNQKTISIQNRLGNIGQDLEFERQYGNHTAAFKQMLDSILIDINRLQNIDIDIFTSQDVQDAEKVFDIVRQLTKEKKLSANKLANENSVAKGLTQINSILSSNTKSSFQKTPVYQQLQLLKNEFEHFDTSKPQSELNALNSRLLRTKAEFEGLSNSVKGKNFLEVFVDRLRGANAQLIAQYLSFQDIIRYARTTISTLIDLDTQLVDLRKTTTMSSLELDNFYHNSAEVAKQLGVTTSEIISQAAAWSRLGYSTSEAATEMAQLSSQFASISPGMSTDEAQTGLVSVMKAWDVGVENVERDIMDNINTLGNKFAETNLDIITGMEKAGATLSAIGTSIEDSFALFTGAQEVIQNAETVGTALKTLSLRIRGYDEETEELSDDVINAMGKVADLTKVAENNYAGISLWADAEQTKYRSLKDYLGDIAKIWDSISEGNRTELLDKLFGKRGASVGSAILGNFDQVEHAIEEMENAAGSADREMGIIRDSLEFKLNAIKQEWVETLTTITDRGDIGKVLDGLLKLSEGLGWIIDKLGLLGTAIASVGSIWLTSKMNKESFGNLSKLFQSYDGFMKQGNNQVFLNNILGKWNDQAFNNSLIENEARKLGDVNDQLVLYAQNARTAGMTTNEFNKYLNSQFGITNNLIGVFKTLGSTILKALGGLAKAGIATAISMLVAKGISALTTWIDKIHITKKEAEELAESFKDSFATMEKGQKEFLDKISTVKEGQTQSIEQEFMELSKGVDSLGRNVSLSTEEFERYHEITSLIEANIPNLVKGYDDQGNAIITLTDNVTTLTDAYKEMQRQQAYDLWNSKDDKGTSVMKGTLKNVDDTLNTAEIEKTRNEAFQKELRYLLSANSYDELQAIYNDALYSKNLDITTLLDKAGWRDTDNYNEIHQNLMSAYRETESLIRDYDNQLKSSVRTLSQSAKTYLHSLTEYSSEFSDEQRRLVDSFFSTLDDTDSLNKIKEMYGIESLSEMEDVQNFVSNIVGDFEKLGEIKGYNEQIDAKFNLTTKFNNNEISLAEYESQLSELYNWLDSIEDENVKNVVSILFDITTEEEGTIEDKVDYLKALMGSNWDEKYKSMLTNEELDIIMDLELDETSVITVEDKLKELGAGGNVDLTIRPKIDTQELKNAGWAAPWKEMGGDYATTFTSTYSNAFGTKYANFTPIIVDPTTGEYKGVMSPTELQRYAEEVIEGVHDDNLKLKIGMDFDTAEDAEAAAEEVHKIQELYYSGLPTMMVRDNQYYDWTDIEKFITDKKGLSSKIKVSTEYPSAMFDNLSTALSEQKSQGYLSTETLNNLRNSFSGLNEEIYKFTENGVMLNTEAMTKYAEATAQAALIGNELKESLAVKEYNQQAATLKKLIGTDEKLNKAYRQGREELKKYVTTTKDFNEEKRDEILASLDRLGTLADEINGYDMVEAQIRAATSALNDYVRATETPNLSDNFNTAKTAVESLKDSFTKGWTGTDEFREGMEYIAGYDFNPDIMEYGTGAYRADWADVVEKYIERGERYFTDDIEGIYNFLDDAVEKTDGMIKKYADGTYSIQIEDLDAFAQKMDLSVSAAMDLLLATSEAWDFNLDFDNITQNIVDGLNAIKDNSTATRTDIEQFNEQIEALEKAGVDVSELREAYNDVVKEFEDSNPTIQFNMELSQKSREEVLKEAEELAEDVSKKMSKEFGEDIEIKFDLGLEDTENLISQVQQYRDSLQPNTTEWKEAQTVLAGLVQQKLELEKPAILSVDASQLEGETAGALLLLQEFYDAYSDYETQLTLGADTSDAEQKLDTIKTKLSNLSGETAGALGIGTIDFTADTSDIIEQLGKIDADNIVGKNSTVKIKADTSEAQAEFNKLKTNLNRNPVIIRLNANTTLVDEAIRQITNKTYTIKLTTSGGTTGGVKTPAGTTPYIPRGGNAAGSDGVERTGLSLVGELGREILVRDGRVSILGQNGAEIVPLRQGDIIFNADQTQELLSTHKINSQGQIVGSYAGGTSTRIYGDGFGYKAGGSGWKKKNNSSSSSSSGKTNSSGSGSSTADDAEETAETFDWIEVKIQRVEEEIARLDERVENTYDLWANRNQSLISEMDTINDEIEIQRAGYERYLEEAESVGLSEEYAFKVRNGLIDIETIKNNEELVEQINLYQQWYDKAVACSDAAQTLTIRLGELSRTKFDNLQTEFEEILSYFESYSDLIEERITRTEEKGYFVSKKYYENLINYEKQSLDTLENEYNGLIQKRDEAVASGYIKENSEEWHSMNQEILDTGKSIEEAQTNLVKFAKEMRQIDWDVFDYVQGRIDKVNEEFEFLIDLLDNQKIYDDWGIFNERGWADTALHASEYNVYMSKALDYAKEREKIEKELANDKANKDLIERREELIKLQQESIKNAYTEKEAVKELVAEGINIHLEKLQEVIDEYTKAIKDARDLYDYQKNIKEQTTNITNLQKQLTAYAGDNSEESRATIQKLQKSLSEAQDQLKETEWDKYISETETFLSDMYDEYSEVLNARLDNIDKLMHDMIDESNQRAYEIKEVVSEVAKDVDYELSQSTKTLLSDALLNNPALTMVSDFKVKFDTYSTTTQKLLEDIKAYVNSISQNTVKEAVPAEKLAPINKVSGTVPNTPTTTNNKSNNNNNNNNTNNNANKNNNAASSSGDGKPAVGDKVTYISGKYFQDSYGEGRSGNQYLGKEVYITKINTKGSKPYHISTGSTLGNGDLGWLTLEQLKGYKTGSRYTQNELAWTNENGEDEYIYRSSDGAILTPLDAGGKVFTAEMSENLWNLAQFKSLPTIPMNGNAGKTINNNNAININLPNVQNYEQFKNALQNDPKMTQFIQQITLGEVTNGIKLNKKKF